MNFRILVLLVTASALIGCAGSDGNPCEGITCSGHGTCQEQDGSAVCDCDDGYYPDGPECLLEPTAEEFIQGADLDPCTANVPVCQTTAGCVLGDKKYIQGRFPGFANFVVVTPADAVIAVRLFFDNQMHPGEATEITWYEPGCHDSYNYESQGADIFALAGADRVFSQEQTVRISGDHLVEIYSDSTADYYLRVQVIVD